MMESYENYPDKRIRLLPKAYEKMFFYAKYAKGEISGFGKTREVKNHILVEDVMVFKQKCCSVETTLDKGALSSFLLRLAKKGKSSNEYNLWWHTHYDFDAFFSPKDEDAIAYLTKKYKWISICINQAGDMIGRVDERGTREDLPIVIQPHHNTKISDQCKRIIKRKVEFEKAKKERDTIILDNENLVTKGINDGLFSPGGIDSDGSLEKLGSELNRSGSFGEFFRPYDY